MRSGIGLTRSLTARWPKGIRQPLSMLQASHNRRAFRDSAAAAGMPRFGLGMQNIANPAWAAETPQPQLRHPTLAEESQEYPEVTTSAAELHHWRVAADRLQAELSWKHWSWTGLGFLTASLAVAVATPFIFRVPLPNQAPQDRSGHNGSANTDPTTGSRKSVGHIATGEGAVDSMVTVGGTSILAADSVAAADQRMQQNPRRHRINRLWAWDRLCTVLRLNGLLCVLYGGGKYLSKSVLAGAAPKPYVPAGVPGVVLMVVVTASTVWAIPNPRETRLWA